MSGGVPPRPGWQLPEPTEAEKAVVLAFLNRPDRKTRREAVIRALRDRLDRLMLPMGFVRDGADWERDLPAGQARVAIQRFSGGVNATLVVAFVPKRRPAHVHADRLWTQLPNFVLTGEHRFARDGTIHYALADHDAATMDFPLAVLRDRALPWLLAHGQGDFPDLQDFRKRPLGEP
ncbi:hypothetical protein [Tabrizicola flagellatus]|uniref:hypothetical protein n=1 Tax=Tabrizicola flagellatus TaxID=2593021 RepID=UPI0011F2B2EB|nr:hypothetical protein [Tabrizicola flagellatus]